MPSWVLDFFLSGFRLGSITSTLDAESVFDAREPPTNRILRFYRENGITDNAAIIRTCVADDITFLGLQSRVDSTYLGLAKKAFRGEDRIEEENLTPEDTARLSRYEDF